MRLAEIVAMAEPALAIPDAVAASHRFHASMADLGATYLQTRLYRRPAGVLDSDRHYEAGGFLARFAPEDWPGSEAFNYICFDCNPLLDAIRARRTRYRFSDFAPRGTKAYGTYWQALSQAGIADALCATSYGDDRTIASLHLGFGEAQPDPATARAIQFAGLMLTEHLLEIGLPDPPEMPQLTTRERDSLALVADGKSDWEISVILGIAESTARFHVDNARRKLNAVNRAQAVAKLVVAGML